MDSFPQYNGFETFPHGPAPITVVHGSQFYPHHDPNAMIGTVSILPSPTEGTAKPTFLGPMGQWPYPSVPDVTHWAPRSPFEALSPSDGQSSPCMSSPRLSYNDAMSPVSSYESCGPSSPYPDPPPVAYYERAHEVPVHGPVHPVTSSNLRLHNTSNTGSQGFRGLYDSTVAKCEVTTTSSNSMSKTSRKAFASKKGNKRSSTRVQKRGAAQSPKKAQRNKLNVPPQRSSKPTKARKDGGRLFDCCFSRYGCTSTFPSKNEWKRHVTSQHIQPGFYRCDTGRCIQNLKGGDMDQCSDMLLVNDFNRKDLFMQHQRRMHAPWVAKKNREPTTEEKKQFEVRLEGIVKRCWRQQRPLPARSQCGFCCQEFGGPNAWKERMEHVGRHYEKADAGPKTEDLALRDWAIQHGVIQTVGDKLKLTSLCRNS